MLAVNFLVMMVEKVEVIRAAVVAALRLQVSKLTVALVTEVRDLNLG
jgi:hypothetical protein